MVHFFREWLFLLLWSRMVGGGGDWWVGWDLGVLVLYVRNRYAPVPEGFQVEVKAVVPVFSFIAAYPVVLKVEFSLGVFLHPILLALLVEAEFSWKFDFAALGYHRGLILRIVDCGEMHWKCEKPYNPKVDSV
ncbi:hypothetical protein L2E82_16255 [Cichorium intybus]|uniref:Uncharacterized protein n=1 Tax=Cichorium intybus TaxID=13427 RepID=A0ACB9F602_CICIN|nr:hypothetical protein L2E82_16255 [Cichorium intybus]